MKRIILFAGLCYVFAACGGNADKTSATEETSSVKIASENEKGSQLIAKSGCLTCHKEQEKLIGPGYADVAAKYEATETNINMLANTVIKGGVGNWGEIPMPANAAVTEADAKEMVKYILSIKK